MKSKFPAHKSVWKQIDKADLTPLSICVKKSNTPVLKISYIEKNISRLIDFNVIK